MIYMYIVYNCFNAISVLLCARGYVCIVTNVASKWGKTGVNYTQFAAMHATYAEKGLRILGFPCNQFGSQVMKKTGHTSVNDRTLFCLAVGGIACSQGKHLPQLLNSFWR